MKPLQQMSLGERVITTVVIVVVILLAFAFVGWVSGRWAEAPAAVGSIYEGIAPDAKLLELDKRALDEAYHNQLLKLFNVWLADGGKDPTHFQNGLRNARSAYGRAAIQIARREQELRDKP